MTDREYERMTYLEYRVQALTRKVKGFESGSLYVSMREDFQKMLHEEEARIRKLEHELEQAHAQTRQVRNIWYQANEDLLKDMDRALAAKDREINQLLKRNMELIDQRDAAKDKCLELRRALYEKETEIAELNEKNDALHAQINRDYENSSKPSSQSPNHKKIQNNREKTGRKPGAQPGHEFHPRRKQTLTEETSLKPEPDIADDPDFRKTGEVIRKQLVAIRLLIETTGYSADVYRNSKTGEKYHAPFPPGVVDDVNYDGTVKAFAYLLNQDCCTSIDKTIGFLSDLTGGKLKLSKGFVNGLAKEFAEKTEDERKKVFADLLVSPVLQTDFTNARVNGKTMQVMVCATPDGRKIQYYAREHKGHEGIKDTPVETYQGIMVHDHDKTFYSYGSGHQECDEHVLRYLKGSMENEPHLTWNASMHELVKEMIHYRNTLESAGEEPDATVVKGYEDRYRSIMQKAKEEYEDEPPNRYYRDGYNLYKRLSEAMECYTLFLHDMRVPTTNNLSERSLRKYKRKQAQVMAFRSLDSVAYFCQGLGTLVMMRGQDDINVFDSVAQIFE